MNSDMHDAVSELLGAYALHAVDPAEEALVGAHVENCARCREELAELQGVASVLGTLDVEPASQSWERIAEQLHLTEADTPPSRPWLAMAAGAAVVVLSLALVVQQGRIRQLSDDIADAKTALAVSESWNEQDILKRAATTAMATPGGRLVSLGAGESASQVTIVLSADGTGYVADHNLPRLPEGRTYQLWAVVGDQVISVGVLGEDPGVTPFRVDPRDLAGFAVTEEVSGGVVSSENAAVVAWLSET